MQDSYQNLILPDLKQMLAEKDELGLAEFCDVLHPGVIAGLLSQMPATETWDVLRQATLERRAEIFEFLSLPDQIDIAATLDRAALTTLLEEMAPDDRVDLLSRMSAERVNNLLPLIAQAERNDIRKLLSYPEDTAGAVMTSEYASLPANITVSEAIDQLRQQAPDSETIYYVYILGENRHLNGFVSLRDLILAPPTAVLTDIVRRDVISVRALEDQETAVQKLARYDFIAMPVVDQDGNLVGIITHDDAIDVVQEEATEDAHRQGAIEPLEDGYLDTPLRILAWKRGVWLMLLAIVALMTAAVIEHYEQGHSDNARLKFLIAFLPLVLASGGNAGSQSATLVIRTLALGQLTKNATLPMARRELWLGLALGLSVSFVGYVAAHYVFGHDVSSALVVSLTVLLVVMLGTIAGALLPVFLKRVGMDPALMSNPLIAAIVDVVGVVIYYRVALWLLAA